jgi:hypothetical protein
VSAANSDKKRIERVPCKKETHKKMLYKATKEKYSIEN